MNTITDNYIREQVIVPIGGIEKFRLVICPDGAKLIEYTDEEGQFFGLIIEDNDLFHATISFLERAEVPGVPIDAI